MLQPRRRSCGRPARYRCFVGCVGGRSGKDCALSAGKQIRSVADPFVDLGSKVEMADYVASRDFVGKNPKVAEAFDKAIKKPSTRSTIPSITMQLSR
jgi:hypothetical protein